MLSAIYSENIYAADYVAQGYVTDTEGNRCGSLYWTLDRDGVFTVTGTGPGATYRPCGEERYDAMVPWDRYRHLITYVQFNCTFQGQALYHYNYGPSLNSWFINCVNLIGYSDIPYGITDMSATFMNCRSLQECGLIPDSVITMQYAFVNCISLGSSPVLPTGLRDDVYQKYNNEDVLVPASGLGLTFSGCTSLVSTPDLTRCTYIHDLIGTFVDCTNIVTVQEIPANINYLFNTFTNCKSVRGVLNIQNTNIRLNGMVFGGFSLDNPYILFVVARDAKLYKYIKEQAGDDFRGYEWSDNFVINFNSNGGSNVPSRNIKLEYGSSMDNLIINSYSNHIDNRYYTDVRNTFGDLPVPFKAGMKFDGWYYDTDFNHKAIATDLINPPTISLNNKNILLYAKWVDITKPEINYDFLDNDWRNKPITIHFHITDNENGGLAFIKLINVTSGGEVIDFVNFNESKISHDYSYTFGDISSKLYEGITRWKLISEDIWGNYTEIEVEIKLDYTKPVIKYGIETDSFEYVYVETDEITVFCEDELSGPGLLRINPSYSQNNFIDMVITPYVMESPFTINYVFGPAKKGAEGLSDSVAQDKGAICQGFVVYAIDRAGNYSTSLIFTRDNILSRIRRVIPRANYD